jgi:hypothetical protein
METMKAFWRYDWALNRTRVITVAVLAALLPWVAIAVRPGLDSGEPWPVLAGAFVAVCAVLIPGIILRYVSHVGRTGSPLDFKHFSHLLPIDPGKWALAKIVSVIVFGVLLPGGLWLGMSVAAGCLSARTVSMSVQDLMSVMLPCLTIVSFITAAALWVMLFESLMPRVSNERAEMLGLGSVRGVQQKGGSW